MQSFFPAMTKIVGTLGPRSESVEVISSLLNAGMSGNFSAFFFFFEFMLLILIISVEFWISMIFCFDVVARFDFSWGDADTHRQTLENLKAAVKATKKLCAVCLLFFLFIFVIIEFFYLILWFRLLINRDLLICQISSVFFVSEKSEPNLRWKPLLFNFSLASVLM